MKRRREEREKELAWMEEEKARMLRRGVATFPTIPILSLPGGPGDVRS